MTAGPPSIAPVADAAPDAPRFAIYFAPAAGSALHDVAARWLGRDAQTDEPQPQPSVPGLTPERLAEITASPRLYGFHATLKPPMRLVPDKTEAHLCEQLEIFADGIDAFTITLQLRSLHGFLALMLGTPSPELHTMADQCVERFDGFRAPPAEAERAKRKAVGLSPEQAQHLDRWGYPYVFDQFRFHMTLTERLSEADRAIVEPVLKDLTRPFCGVPVPVDQVALFRQDGPGAPFRIVERFAFRRSPRGADAPPA